jgi:predicted transcriptional regulator
VPAAPKRINVTLDPAQAAKLARLAERSHLQEGTLARSLLSVAIDAADPDAHHVHLILDSIPGALDRATAGLAEARAGETVPIDEV